MKRKDRLQRSGLTHAHRQLYAMLVRILDSRTHCFANMLKSHALTTQSHDAKQIFESFDLSSVLGRKLDWQVLDTSFSLQSMEFLIRVILCQNPLNKIHVRTCSF